MSKRPPDKGKGKAQKEEVKPQKREVSTSYKAIALLEPKVVKQQKLNDTPKEEKLRNDAYILAESSNSGDYIYPYIPISTKWIIPVENKYANLQPSEVVTFYFKNNADSFVYPKDFQFYQDILVAMGSVEFDLTNRNGADIAYGKATILRVIKQEQWTGELFKPYELTRPIRGRNTTVKFNYFDYINAWEHAFYYENKQRKFSWFIRFSENFVLKKDSDIPNWFIKWFSQLGLYPICLPDKIRTVYDDFVDLNSSLTNTSLWFTVLYQVPWILKWEPVITLRSFSNLGETFKPIPYLGRRVYIKWWQKFEFFKNSAFSVKGLIDLGPPPPPKTNVDDLFKEFSTKLSKEEMSKFLILLQDKANTASSSSTKEDEDKITVEAMEEDDPLDMMNEYLQDAQDPCAE